MNSKIKVQVTSGQISYDHFKSKVDVPSWTVPEDLSDVQTMFYGSWLALLT